MKIPCKAVFIQELTDLVEEAVLAGEALDRRGGVLGAMETVPTQQDSRRSMYEGPSSGELPIIGVNTYLNPERKAKWVIPSSFAPPKKKKNHNTALNAPMRSTKPNQDWRSNNLNSRPKKDNLFAELLETLKLARSDKFLTRFMRWAGLIAEACIHKPVCCP